MPAPSSSTHVSPRSRLAVVLLLLRANFLVVVLAAGALAAILRALGWG
jgi:hypothetical protein